MFNVFRLLQISFFASKVSGALHDLGIDRRKLPSEPFNSFCERVLGASQRHEAAATFFCENFHQFPPSSYTLPIGGYDLVFRASKIIGVWRDKALMPATAAQKLINRLEEVCRMIEQQNPQIFKKTGALPPQEAESARYETLGWNLMVNATNPDRCWAIAQHFRRTNIPGSALTCEMAFLTASMVRSAVKSSFPVHSRDKAISSAEAAYFKTFDDEARKALTDEMKAVYGSIQINQLAKSVLAQYGQKNDTLPLTVPLFIHRIHGDPRMLFEIMPSLEEAQDQIIGAAKKWLRSNPA